MKKESYISSDRVEWEISSFGNPMMWLNPQRLRMALDSFQYGDLSSAAKIFDAIARRDDFTRTVVAKRKGAISALDWDITPVGDNPEASKKHSEVLTKFFENIEVTHAIDRNRKGCVGMLVEQMLDALGSKFSVHEINWRTSTEGLHAELRFVPLWFFENRTGKLRFLETPSAATGVEMKDGEWLVCVHDVALMEATAIVYFAKNCAWKDWLVFSERFGFPLVKGETDSPVNSPEWNTFYNALASVRNGNFILSSTQSKVELLQATGTGSPFEKIVTLSNRAISSLWRGSDLGTMSSQDGAGASLQGDETAVLENSDATMIEEAIEHNLTHRVIEYWFGRGVKPAAKFILQRTDRTNIKDYLAVVERAARLGIEIAKDDVRSICKLPIPDDGAELVTPPANGEPLNRISENEGDADLVKLAKARGGDVAAVVNALEKIISETSDNETYLSALEIFETDLPKFFSGGENEAEALAKILEKAAALGVNFNQEKK